MLMTDGVWLADERSFLRSVDALLDAVTAAFPEVGRPDDEHADAVGNRAGGNETSPGVECDPILFAFDCLLKEELAREHDLAECGYLVDPGIYYGVTFGKNGDGDIMCHVGAIIHDHNGTPFVIRLHAPTVDEIIPGDIQRPIGQQVRVCALLVRIGCQCVGFPGDHVGFLRHAVRRLRQLVALMRLEQSDGSGDASKRSDAADGKVDDSRDVHTNDSTDAKETE